MVTKQQKNSEFAIFKAVIQNMGGSVEEVVSERKYYRVNIRGKELLLQKFISIGKNSSSTVFSTKHKDITYRLLRDANLPTPKTFSFYLKTYDKIKALKKLSQLDYPVIIKDANGTCSRGIFLNIANEEQAQKIIESRLQKYKSMIAQEMVFGREYRILVLDNRVIGALEMIHPYVTGDGTSTVRELIEEKQADTKKHTAFDSKLEQTLRAQKTSLDSIPPEGTVIIFKKHSSLAEGGETRDVTNLVHPDVARICIEASKAVGRCLVGIDVMHEDISKKPKNKSFNILEINSKPDLYIHHKPTHGKSRNVLKDVVTFLIRPTE